MSERVRSYEHDGFVVEYLPGRCIHAEECVKGLPQVFNPDRRPWIDPAEAKADDIAETVQRCPTGALRFRYPGDSPREKPDTEATIEIVPAGPLYIRGDLRLAGPDGQVNHESRVALCRCGVSQNKPLCDNSHVEAGFEDIGTAGESKLAPVAGSESPGIDIKPAPNGPLLIDGPVVIVGSDEQRIEGGRGALCRCGASNNKPFCDGSHVRIGFETNQQRKTT